MIRFHRSDLLLMTTFSEIMVWFSLSLLAGFENCPYSTGVFISGKSNQDDKQFHKISLTENSNVTDLSTVTLGTHCQVRTRCPGSDDACSSMERKTRPTLETTTLFQAKRNTRASVHLMQRNKQGYLWSTPSMYCARLPQHDPEWT